MWGDGTPPHTRVGRTGGCDPMHVSARTSPHTHGKNFSHLPRRPPEEHLPTHAWEEPGPRPGPGPGPSTSPHTHGKNGGLSLRYYREEHLPTHAWEEQYLTIKKARPVAPPHTRVGRTPYFNSPYPRPTTSPHTHGKNSGRFRWGELFSHLPTHAWEEPVVA